MSVELTTEIGETAERKAPPAVGLQRFVRWLACLWLAFRASAASVLLRLLLLDLMSAPCLRLGLPDRLAALSRQGALKARSHDLLEQGFEFRDFLLELGQFLGRKLVAAKRLVADGVAVIGGDRAEFGHSVFFDSGEFDVGRIHGYNIRKRLAYSNKNLQLFLGQ